MDASVLPLLALIVDGRHLADYGNVYAIAELSLSLAFSIGTWVNIRGIFNCYSRKLPIRGIDGCVKFSL